MLCRQIGDGPCKTYLLASEKTREAVLVDPLLQKIDEDLRLLASEGLKLALVIDSHTHADHLSAGAALSERAGVPYLMHRDSRSARVNRRASDGEVLSFGDLRVSLLHTPGHTADSLTLVLEDRVLSGDFLFIGADGAGRLDLPGSDPAVHFDSLKKIEGLPDRLLLSPAHDYRGAAESTLGAERKANPVLTPRGRDAYVRWWLDKKFGPADWMKGVVKANLAGAFDLNAATIPAGNAACACVGGPADAASHPALSPKDLAKMLKDKTSPLVLLDVRTPEEFTDELGHIKGAVLIPVDELAGRIKEVPPGPIVSICRSGKRAARAATMLRGAGREQVWVLTGGMLAWNEELLPVA